MPVKAKLHAVARGDKAVLATMFRDYQPRYLSYATGLLAGDRQAAEDVVHEAFLAIWQQAGSFTGSGSAEGWMRRIVRNKAVDWCRKQRELPMTAAVETHHISSTHDTRYSPFDNAAQSDAARALRSALTILSVEQREAVWLCYFEECSIAQIAAIAGCPENTVKTRLFHARKLLRGSALLAG